MFILKTLKAIRKFPLWMLDHMAGTYLSLIFLAAASSAIMASSWTAYNVPETTLAKRVDEHLLDLEG